MAYQVLARKWRPQKFSEVVGQSTVVKSLTHALETQRLHHAYLFTGTRGVGKTTIARLLAKALSCESPNGVEPCGHCQHCQAINEGSFVDLIEVDAASRTKVEDTKQLLDNVPYAPVVGAYKIYLIDEVHMLSTHSFNALLKTLEEPPAHVKFLFATTDPQKLPMTVLSRCLQFHLMPLTTHEITQHIEHILSQEAISFDGQSVQSIAAAAGGSVRDALSLLDQAISLGEGSVNTASVADMLGGQAHRHLPELLRVIAVGEGAALSKVLASIAECSPQYETLLDEVASLCHQLSFLQLGVSLAAQPFITQPQLAELASLYQPTQLQLIYDIALKGQKDLSFSRDKRVGFEMVALRMLAFRTTTALPKVIQTDAKISEQPKRERASSAASPATVIDAAPEKAAPKVVSEPKVAQSPVVEPQIQTPAPVAVEPSVKAPEPAADVLSTSDDIQSRWHDLVQRLSLDGIAKMIATQCVPTSWDAQTLSLTLTHTHAAMLNKAQEVRIGDAIKDALGTHINVAINVGTVDVPTPAVRMEAAVKAHQSKVVSEVQQDPVVKELVDTFDASVTNIVVKDES